jgi:hypothetical protein
MLSVVTVTCPDTSLFTQRCKLAASTKCHCSTATSMAVASAYVDDRKGKERNGTQRGRLDLQGAAGDAEQYANTKEFMV